MRILILFALIFLAAPAQAANLPDSKDGPAGCGWRAAVVDRHPGDDFVVDLVLTQMISKCVYNPGPCGTKEDHVSVHVKKDDIKSYQVGQITKVWVTGDVVSLDIPQCMRGPGL